LTVEPEPFVTGYRCWLVTNGRLRSVFTGTVWPPRERFVSPEPHEFGDTGVHAYVSRVSALSWLGRQSPDVTWFVAGAVRLWGVVLVHEIGYRAQFAYPECLWCPRNLDPVLMMELEGTYGIPAVYV